LYYRDKPVTNDSHSFFKLQHLMSDNNVTKLARHTNRLNDIERYIHENITADLRIEAIAKKFNISPSSLKLLFSRYKCKSCRRYLEEIRLAKALELLQEQNASVKEAMYGSGYKHRSSFNKAFSKKYGHSPVYFMK